MLRSFGPRPALLAPLAHRDFRLLWVGQTFSIVGNFVQTIAMPWQVLQLTGSATQIGIVVAISLATNVALLLFGGAIVDRVPRRRVLLASDLISGIVFATVAVLGGNGLLRIEHLYVATALAAACNAFFGPAMTAIIPELVPVDVLRAGNSLRGFSRQGGRVLGPVLGGLLIASSGPAAAFAFDAVTFFVSFAALVAMRGTPTVSRVRLGMVAEVREGFAFVLSRGWLWATIAIASVINTFLIAANSVALPIQLRDVLRLDATAFGAAFAAQGIGEAIGAILAGQLHIRRVGLTMYACVALCGVAMFGYAVPFLGAVLVSAVLWGVGIVGFGVLWDSALQRQVPREVLGRVSSVDGFGSIIFAPIGPLIAGTVVTTYGPQPAFVAAGLLTLLAVPVGLSVRSVRDLT